ncbi:hypothetical protein ESP47_10685 [Heyndrickxia coagulans]|nr:hypothetical protein CIW84_03065 [Heyndrickxia coagulans]OZV95373.1 hypothetical protein CAY57_11650 [Heyndrickxia coagulans]QAU27488.1 hypothetical protein ESP47_10685 [Heyndrickxia coagulans]
MNAGINEIHNCFIQREAYVFCFFHVASPFGYKNFKIFCGLLQNFFAFSLKKPHEGLFFMMAFFLHMNG